MAVQIATFVAAFATRFAIKRIEPKALYLTGVSLMLGGYVLPPALRLLGLMPANGPEALVQALYVANVGVGVGTGLIMVCSAVMFAGSADEYAFEKRESRTGLLLAFLPLGNRRSLKPFMLACYRVVLLLWVLFLYRRRPGLFARFRLNNLSGLHRVGLHRLIRKNCFQAEITHVLRSNAR